MLILVFVVWAIIAGVCISKAYDEYKKEQYRQEIIKVAKDFNEELGIRSEE